MLREFSGGRSKLTWKVLTGDETWIYRYDPETKMRSVVWLFPNESPACTPKTQKVTQWTDENGCLFPNESPACTPKLKRSRSGQTKMVVCFSQNSRHAATIPLADRRAITADWYAHHSLLKVFEVWCQALRRRDSVAPHDNAGAQMAATIVDFLSESEVQLPHPSYLFTRLHINKIRPNWANTNLKQS